MKRRVCTIFNMEILQESNKYLQHFFAHLSNLITIFCTLEDTE